MWKQRNALKRQQYLAIISLSEKSCSAMSCFCSAFFLFWKEKSSGDDRTAFVITTLYIFYDVLSLHYLPVDT